MRLSKYWKENVTAFYIEPQTWRPKKDRSWNRFVKAACKLKLEKGTSIRVEHLAPFRKLDFKNLRKEVKKNE